VLNTALKNILPFLGAPPRCTLCIVGLPSKYISAVYNDILQNSWELSDVSESREQANHGNTLKKGKMEVLCIYRPVSLTWLPRKKVHQTIKQSIYKHLQDDKVIKISQHRFVKNKLCQPSLISFFDRLNGFVDKGEAADAIYLDFSRVFTTVLQEIPTNKLGKYDLKEATMRYMPKLPKEKEKRSQIIQCQSGRLFQMEYCLESGIIQYFHY